MKNPSISTLTLILFVAFSCPWAAYASDPENFLECLREEIKNYSSISSVVYSQNNSSYDSVLQFSIRNLRFTLESTPKPVVIITPKQELHIPPIIHCAKENDLQIRTRSGGHDAEGLSSVAHVPFVIIDMINLSDVMVDAEKKTAWVGAGSTLGSIYYRIAQKSSTLGFPAGLGSSVGAGGHFSGGGYGFMFRKYGLAADNIIDARIATVDGKILDREKMGEDLFWAIRGGTGASFGVILAWKLQLVDVPEKVTVFVPTRTLEQNATQLVHRWQYIAPTIERDLYLSIQMRRVNSNQDGRNMTIFASYSNQDGGNMTILASFRSFYLGRVDALLSLMQEKFPELGLVREDCTEMSWIEAIMFFGGFSGYSTGSLEDLLNRTQPGVMYKMTTDFVQKPIPEYGLEGMWRFLYEPQGEGAEIVLTPYGGRMDDISEASIPFPHRKGNLYMLNPVVFWGLEQANNIDGYFNWSRRFYQYLTPFVSKFPRAAYANYRDLDIGVNNIRGKISYARASTWGFKYFKNNFNRLVQVKTKVDPENFFRDEQSIPSLRS